jgi:thiol-disulfide isomerase/thioredoxin
MSKSNSGPTRPTANRSSKSTTSARTGTSGPKRSAGRAPESKSFRLRHPVMTALIPVGLVLAVIATMVVIKATGGSASPSSSHLSSTGTSQSGQTGATALSSAVASSLSVSAATLDAVGSPSGDSLPTVVNGDSILKDEEGKPIVTYVGAEYCPYCAAERWALAVALSRFGTFTNLSATHSASNDVYPNTQTLSFYGSSYSSPYVDFQPVEEATNQLVNGSYQTLQTPTAAQTALLNKYDSAGSIPFLDIANKYVVTGSSYSPQVLQGLTRNQIAAQLSDPSSAVAQAIDGTANDITAAISNVTGNQPSSVANTPAIAAIAKKLGA